MRIAIVGAGPAGLYLALLLGRKLPGADITIHEQNPAGATYGFGVALHSLSWDRLRETDPASHADIMAAATITRDQVIGHRGERITIDSRGANAGISRLALLHILQRHAQAAGARLIDRNRIESAEAIGTADLVVGADGANSAIRDHDLADFAPTHATLTNRMAWYGCTGKIPHPFLIFRQTRFGWFWSVGYAHSDNASTFVAECDAKAWERSGLADMTLEEQRAFSQDMFAEELAGAELLGNNSVWRQLTMVDATRWSSGNRVLIGDALHSPHPTIGSGTRMAMDDAAALATAILADPGDIPAALAAFRAAREPAKRKLLVARDRSIAWYEDIGRIAQDCDPVELVYSYMMRTGRVSVDRLRAESPGFMELYGAMAPV